MQKRARKLRLKFETLHQLSSVVGGVPTDRCEISETCADTCGSSLPVPSVDNCGTIGPQCASLQPPGCASTAPMCL